MSQITTHVLDTSKGRPAPDIPVTLYWSPTQQSLEADSTWNILASKKTNSDGRISDLLSPDYVLESGLYKLVFDTSDYLGEDGFFPLVPIIFRIKNTSRHYHVPLLLSPFGLSTYRGS